MLRERKTKQPSPGKPKAPLTRLKELSAEERAKVLALLREHTYEQAKPLVKQLVGFGCSVDTLGRFFSWQATREALEAAQEMIGEVREFVGKHHPDWTEEKMREAAAVFFMAQTMKKEDARSFACVARLGLQNGRQQLQERKLEFEKEKLERKLNLGEERLELDEAKFEQSKRRKLDVALDALASHFKRNSEAMRLYQQAREIIEREAGMAFF